MSPRRNGEARRAAETAARFLRERGARRVQRGCCLKDETGWVVWLGADGVSRLLHVDRKMHVST